MSHMKARSKSSTVAHDIDCSSPSTGLPGLQGQLLLSVFITLVAVGFVICFSQTMWNVSMGTPLIRDGIVRACVVTIVPRVLGSTSCRSPVNGYVTSLTTQLGEYATIGKNVISIVDAATFWVD